MQKHKKEVFCQKYRTKPKLPDSNGHLKIKIHLIYFIFVKYYRLFFSNSRKFE